MKKAVITKKAPNASMLSQAIVSGDYIFVSGQIHIKPDNSLVEGTIEEQTHVVMKNIQSILQSAGVTMDHIVKATLYVTDMSFGPDINKVYMSYFNDPFPAREMICVKALPFNARLEISVIAHS